MKKLVFLISLFLFNNLVNAQVRVDKSVQLQLKKSSHVPVLIYLKEHAQLNDIKESWTKEQKGQYVYNNLKSTATRSQSTILNYFKLKKINSKSFFIANAIRAEITSLELSDLMQMDEIVSITYDVATSIESFQHDQDAHQAKQRSAELTWGNKNIQSDLVWQMGIEGEGVTVAGEDTGYRWDLEGIKERYRGWKDSIVDHNYNWHDAIHSISPLASDSINPCGLNSKVPCDDNGHGTHTMGTMVGKTNEYLYGVAPKAKWIGCRNMERGNGALSTYIECFEYFMAPTDTNGLNPLPSLAPHVINNSWYCSIEEGCNLSNFEVMHEVIKNLRKAGIVVVVSAGNQGANCSTIAHPPSMFEESFSIGSFAENDSISGFSAMGPVKIDSSLRIKPNVVAPGSAVLSRTMGGNYEAWNGTSMAGPHTAGLVALIISANPKLAGNVEQIENIIESTSRPANAHFVCDTFSMDAIPNNMYGYGKINAFAAVQKAQLYVAAQDIDRDEKIKIFPNPGKDFLKIQSISALEKISVYNAIGQLIYTHRTNESTFYIDTKSWDSGLYFIRNSVSTTGNIWIKQE